MVHSTDLISGEKAWCDISVDSVNKIFQPIPVIGPVIASIFGPFTCVFAGTLGAIGGASLDKDTLDSLQLQTLKNIYVAGLLGFFLFFGPLSRIPGLYPLAIIAGGINVIIALMIAIPFGVFADIISPPWGKAA